MSTRVSHPLTHILISDFFSLSSSTFHFEINDERAERGDLRSKRCILRVGVGFGLHAASVASRLNDICTARCADMHLSFRAGRRSKDLQMRGEKEARAYRMRFKSFLNLNVKTTRLFLLPFFTRSTQRSKAFSRYAQGRFVFLRYCSQICLNLPVSTSPLTR